MDVFKDQKKQVMGIEPTYLAWKASVLPLNYTRGVGVTGFEPATSWSQTRRSSQAEPHPGYARQRFSVLQCMDNYILCGFSCQPFYTINCVFEKVILYEINTIFSAARLHSDVLTDN